METDLLLDGLALLLLLHIFCFKKNYLMDLKSSRDRNVIRVCSAVMSNAYP